MATTNNNSMRAVANLDVIKNNVMKDNQCTCGNTTNEDGTCSNVQTCENK